MQEGLAINPNAERPVPDMGARTNMIYAIVLILALAAVVLNGMSAEENENILSVVAGEFMFARRNGGGEAMLKLLDEHSSLKRYHRNIVVYYGPHRDDVRDQLTLTLWSVPGEGELGAPMAELLITFAAKEEDTSFRYGFPNRIQSP